MLMRLIVGWENGLRDEGRCTPVGVLVRTGFFASLCIVCFWYFGQRGYTSILAMYWLCTGYAHSLAGKCWYGLPYSSVSKRKEPFAAQPPQISTHSMFLDKDNP